MMIKEICSWQPPFCKQNLLLFTQPRWQLYPYTLLHFYMYVLCKNVFLSIVGMHWPKIVMAGRAVCCKEFSGPTRFIPSLEEAWPGLQFHYQLLVTYVQKAVWRNRDQEDTTAHNVFTITKCNLERMI